MERVVMAVRRGDVRKIKITCRCGRVFVAEVPQQIATAVSLWPCPGCSAPFTIQKVGEKWKIERVADSMSDLSFVEDSLATPKHESIPVGLRIKIVSAEGKAIGENMIGADPHPEHVGKYGTVVGEMEVGNGHTTPYIRLDDGTMLTGAECWWEPVRM